MFQLYESVYEEFQDGKRDENGHFAVDQYSGRNTNFKVYFTNLVESYIKSISIESQDGNSFNTLMDSRMSLHYLSIYNVPFDKVTIFYQQFISNKKYTFLGFQCWCFVEVQPIPHPLSVIKKRAYCPSNLKCCEQCYYCEYLD